MAEPNNASAARTEYIVMDDGTVDVRLAHASEANADKIGHDYKRGYRTASHNVRHSDRITTERNVHERDAERAHTIRRATTAQDFTTTIAAVQCAIPQRVRAARARAGAYKSRPARIVDTDVSQSERDAASTGSYEAVGHARAGKAIALAQRVSGKTQRRCGDCELRAAAHIKVNGGPAAGHYANIRCRFVSN